MNFGAGRGARRSNPEPSLKWPILRGVRLFGVVCGVDLRLVPTPTRAAEFKPAEGTA